MNTRSRFLLFASILLICLTFTACNRNKKVEPTVAVELNEQTVTTFAKTIAEGIIHGNAEALNNVIDKANIKQIVSGNSIVYSGFDVEGGQHYFENCLRLGEPLVAAINNGGDFVFTRHYTENNLHHIVFRSYDNFVVNFYDFTVDTANGKMLLQDGFIYNAGCLLSKSVEGGMLYNLMLQTNPESDVKWLKQAEELTKNGQSAKALNLLKEHQEALKEYPIFYPLYIANLYQNDKANFLTQLDALNGAVDQRTLLLHKLLYCINEGNVAECEAVVNQLIPSAGDDPIFMFLYGYANLNAKNYAEALNCFKTIDNAMPLIWDLWQCELQCYRKTNDVAGLEQCLQKGKAAYGMSDEELKEYR